MDRLDIVSAPVVGSDYRINRIQLAKHLGLTDMVCALEVPGYRK